MGYKHHELDPAPLLKNLIRPNFMIKSIPHMDCTPHICELACYNCEYITLKDAWSGSATIQLLEHAQYRRYTLMHCSSLLGTLDTKPTMGDTHESVGALNRSIGKRPAGQCVTLAVIRAARGCRRAVIDQNGEGPGLG